jgi:hypothetical protein
MWFVFGENSIKLLFWWKWKHIRYGIELINLKSEPDDSDIAMLYCLIVSHMQV